jgi:hypothetical protein
MRRRSTTAPGYARPSASQGPTAQRCSWPHADDNRIVLRMFQLLRRYPLDVPLLIHPAHHCALLDPDVAVELRRPGGHEHAAMCLGGTRRTRRVRRSLSAARRPGEHQGQFCPLCPLSPLRGQRDV